MSEAAKLEKKLNCLGPIPNSMSSVVEQFQILDLVNFQTALKMLWLTTISRSLDCFLGKVLAKWIIWVVNEPLDVTLFRICLH